MQGGEDLPAGPEIGMAHMGPLLGAGEGEGEAAEFVLRGHGARLIMVAGRPPNP
ncbi:hypothetical protein D3C83_239120 [compost metagenome]